jgi:hypothetical protein
MREGILVIKVKKQKERVVVGVEEDRGLGRTSCNLQAAMW